MNKNKFFAGIDMGSGFVKFVIMSGVEIVSSRIIPTRGTYETIVNEGINATLAEVGIAFDDLGGVVITGYSKYTPQFEHRRVSPLWAGAVGALFFCPTARTVLDVGLQQSSVVRLDEEGNIADSIVSEKCASGSGWLLNVVARVMGLKSEDLGPFSLRAKKPVNITTDCAVFAETEVISRVAEGNSREDIIAGAHRALAFKVKSLIERIGLEPDVVLLGGTGKDEGFIKNLDDILGLGVKVPKDARLAAAIGAILFHFGQ